MLLNLVGDFMSFPFPLSDSLTRIRNAQVVNLSTVSVTFSNLIYSVLSVMYKQGYISYFKKKVSSSGMNFIEVGIKYYRNVPVIRDLRVLSKPGRRVYVACEDIGDFYNGLGIYIVSTSKGVLSGQDAVKLRVGGELLCAVF